MIHRTLLGLGAVAVVATPVLLFVAGARDPLEFVDAVWLAPAFFLAGAVAFRQRPEHPGARRLLLVGALIAISHLLAVVPAAVGEDRQGFWLLNLGSRVSLAVAFAAWGALYASFPDGSYRRRSERVFARVAFAVALVLPAVHFFSAPRQELAYVISTPSTAAPFAAPALAVPGAAAPAIFLFPVAGLVFLLLRHRGASPQERERTRWVIASAVVVAAALVTTPLLEWIAGAAVQTVVFMIAATSLPIALLVGMLRHRLFDIDLVARRSFVYGTLWLLIALIYAAVSAMLGIAAGQRLPVGAAVVVTIVAAMAFQPARRRLERLADRLVFGERLNGYEAIRQLGVTLESTFELEELAPRIEAAVERGLGATWARVSLDHDSAGPGSAAALAVPLIHGNELLGALEVGPKRDGEWTSADRELLHTLSRQMALAVRNVRLAADLAERVEELGRHARELAASRTRIIQAEEGERRRIERDLHDGIQQELVALMAKVELARGQLATDPARTERTLAELQHLSRQTHMELRELVRGIHPAVLTDQGLAPAIEAALARLPIDVRLEVGPSVRGLRLAPEVEGAAYFLVCETTANLVKHARAHTGVVRLDCARGELSVEVEDDGRGFEPGVDKGSGLRGLQDRVEALGGRVTIDSAPGGGTRVVAVLPARERERA